MIIVLCHEYHQENNHCKNEATTPRWSNAQSTVICKTDTRGHRRDSFNCTTSLFICPLDSKLHTYVHSEWHLFCLLFYSVWLVVKVASFYLFTLSLYPPLSYWPDASVLPLCQWKVVNTSIRGQVMLCLFIFRSTQSKLYILYLFYIYGCLFCHFILAPFLCHHVVVIFLFSFMLFFSLQKASRAFLALATMECRWGKLIARCLINTSYICTHTLSHTGKAYL